MRLQAMNKEIQTYINVNSVEARKQSLKLKD